MRSSSDNARGTRRGRADSRSSSRVGFAGTAPWRTARAITPETMLRHVRPVAGPTCSCTSVTNRSTSGVVTSWSRSAPRAGKTCAFSCREYVSTVPGDRCPSPANRSTRSNHTAAAAAKVSEPRRLPAPRRARSAKAASRAVRAAHSVRASRSTIRRTPSKSRNHARARYTTRPATSTSTLHPTPLGPAGGEASLSHRPSHPVQPGEHVRLAKSKVLAKPQAWRTIASRPPVTDRLNRHTQKCGDIRCRPQRVMPRAHHPPPPSAPASPTRRIPRSSP